MSTLQPRPNINHLLRFSTMYQHQIYIGTNVTPAFFFYIKSPEAFVFLWSKVEFLKAHPSINIINGVEKDPVSYNYYINMQQEETKKPQKFGQQLS